jgi:aminoglycoside phosphotransferase (APT) family kinase protein
VSARRYASVRYPWSAAIDVSSPYPARHYAALVSQALRFTLPARRTPAPLWTLLARTGLPPAPVARLAALGRRRARPDLEAVVAEVESAFPEVVKGPVSVLAMERRAALTIFLFDQDGRPLVVAKVPPPGDERVDVELRALEEAAPAAVAPRALGRAGDARVQEAIAGAPLELQPVTPESAGSLRWTPELGQLAEGLERLAKATRKDEVPDEIEAPLERALGSGLLEARAAERLRAAWSELRGRPGAVLRNRDTSAQNCLYDDGRLTGIVDWEGAVPLGAPGFDLLNAALAWVEQGVGMTRWSQEAVIESYRAAWSGGFGEAAHADAVRCAAAGGLDPAAGDALELVFLGWRVGRRLDNPAFYPTTAATAARMLEIACTR